MKQWFVGRKTWQKIAIGVFLWPFMAAWWFWTNPRFTTKTKAIVTAVAIPAIAIMGALSDTTDKTETVSAGSVKETTSTTAALSPSSSAPTTTTVPAPTTSTTADPDAVRRATEQELQSKVSKALGKTNRKASPRVTVAYPLDGGRVMITWAINENLTEGLTKDTARLEATEILEAVHTINPATSEVYLEGTYSLVDKLGNTEEDTVYRGAYEPETVNGINYDGFNFKNAFERGVALSPWVHPAFVY